MTSPTLIWLETSHHTAFRVGGWAFVRRDPAGAITGYAGGERRLEAERTALLGLVAALKEVRGPVRVQTGSTLVAAIPARIDAAQAGEDPPADNLELWAQAIAALAAPGVQIVAASPGDRTAAFAAAWAELGRDRGKDKGAFTSAIPKPNLIKAGVA